MYVKLASNENELRMPYIHAMQCGNTHVRSMSEREIEFFSLHGDIVGVFCLHACNSVALIAQYRATHGKCISSDLIFQPCFIAESAMPTPDLDMIPTRFLVVWHTVVTTDCTRQITFIR